MDASTGFVSCAVISCKYQGFVRISFKKSLVKFLAAWCNAVISFLDQSNRFCMKTAGMPVKGIGMSCSAGRIKLLMLCIDSH